ncbi:unnamed protein product [Clonostachys byssicola]|uniref:Integral membrane protein n=1 Tax=Clonostachys byssicola TaxID=160290 RepID=A0A9N9U971_9HYPO|nr:unnamed protein product [Clonostachys byssicola]
MRKFASSMVGLVTESLKDDAMQIHTTANSSLPGNPNNPYAQQNYNQGGWSQQPQQPHQPHQQPYQQQPYQQAPLPPPGITPSPSSFSPTTYPASASPYANTPQYYAPQLNSGVSSNDAFLPPPLPPPVPATNATAQRQAPGPTYYSPPVHVNQQPLPSSFPVQTQPEEVYLPPPTAPPPHLIAELPGDSAPSASRAFPQQQQQQQYSHPQYGSYAPVSSPPNVAELCSQMGNLGVQTPVSQPEPPSSASPPGPPPPIQELPAPIAPPSAHAPSPATASEDRLLLPPRGPPTIALSGEPNEVIPDCTEGREVSYAMDWYRLPEAPSHLICTRCYADHIQSTALAGAFEKVNQAGGTCCFWLPRIKDQLWEQALQSGDTQALVAFFSETKDLQPCSGRVYNGPEESAAMKWYVVTEAGVLDGFLACQACYVYRISGTSFESRFSPYDQSKLKDTQGIMCDACAPSVAANLRSLSVNGDWHTFVAATAHRLGLPECTLAEPRTFGSDAVSYVLRQGGGGLRVCETCYVDKLMVKGFAGHFERYQKPKPGLRSFLNECIQDTEEGFCSLARMSLNVALDAAHYQRDFSVYKTAAEATSRLPSCTANGIQSSTWWTLQGGCDGLSICEACHAGFLVPTGVAQYFERTRRSSSSPILCSLHITAPRALDLLSHFGQMIEKGLFSHFADYARLWSGVRPCPGLKAQGGGTWFGYHELYMCKECYLECAASQPLADTLPVRDLYEEDLRICQMWSPRMRRLWLETNAAGAVGSPESKAAEDRLRELGTQRFQVYNATVLQIEVMQQMQAMRRRAALHKGVQSTVYAGANSFAMAAGATDGYMYGNSSLGWHGTRNGLVGAQLGMESRAELAQLSGGDETAEISRLQAIWSQVE